jgi:membrane protease YdiL (CAAX protease family)
MLPEKPWRVEAALRLFARLVICMFMGTSMNSALGILLNPRPTHATASLILTVAALGLFASALVVLGRPWQPDRFARNAVILLVCFYGGLSLTWGAMRGPAQPAEVEHSALEVLIAMLSFQGAALVLVHGFLRKHQIGWADAFGLTLEEPRALLLGMAVAFIFLPLAWGLQSTSALVLDHLHVPAQEQEAVQVLRSTESWTCGLLLGIAAILVVPVAEEILFRGILYPMIKQRGFPRLAWWGTSLLFGAIHFNLVTFLPLTVLALCLIWLYERTRNLLAPITAHALFNAMNFAALFLSEWLNRLPAQS